MVNLTSILVIDDDPLILSVMLQVLARAVTPSTNILTAYDGEEGLRIARQAQPDIIITDLMMPRMDGYELVQLLRSEETNSQARIIGVTSSGAMDGRTKAFRTLCDSFLNKPFMPNELIEKLRCVAP
ncbi:MAG: response regulator [Chloroflexi bacterium]|nr:response regulator [Chloroflexota bacterium]